MLTIIFLMLVWHAIADYPLQGDFLAKAKNRLMPIPGVPWWQALSAHALIHAGGVFWITKSLTLAVLEFVSHFIIDTLKCSNKIGFNSDQALHVLCKIIWAAMFYYGFA